MCQTSTTTSCFQSKAYLQYLLLSCPLPILNKPVQQLSCTNSASSESSIHFCFVPSLFFCTLCFPPFPPTQHLLSCDLSYTDKFINVSLAPCHQQNLTFLNMRSWVQSGDCGLYSPWEYLGVMSAPVKMSSQ